MPRRHPERGQLVHHGDRGAALVARLAEHHHEWRNAEANEELGHAQVPLEPAHLAFARVDARSADDGQPAARKRQVVPLDDRALVEGDSEPRLRTSAPRQAIAVQSFRGRTDQAQAMGAGLDRFGRRHRRGQDSPFTTECLRPGALHSVTRTMSRSGDLPFPTTALPQRVLAVALEAVERGQRVVMATVVARHGSAPSTPGQKLALVEDGGATGTIGGGAVERAVLGAMTSMMDDPPACRGWSASASAPSSGCVVAARWRS